MSKSIPTWLTAAIFITAFLGFMDASFLAGEHFLKMTPPCFIVQGCDTVTTSAYSKILGIPVSLLGTLYYLTILITVMYFVDKKNNSTLKLLHAMTSVGLLMSMWFLYVQAFIIKAWCLYCMFSALTSTILFIAVAVAFHRRWPEEKSR